MCGIVAYPGYREAEPILVEGLRRLEYRGYDSAGLATLAGPVLHVRKRAGRVEALANLLSRQPAPGCQGISHTCRATASSSTPAALCARWGSSTVGMREAKGWATAPC